jgi:hypothetical protein
MLEENTEVITAAEAKRRKAVAAALIAEHEVANLLQQTPQHAEIDRLRDRIRFLEQDVERAFSSIAELSTGGTGFWQRPEKPAEPKVARWTRLGAGVEYDPDFVHPDDDANLGQKFDPGEDDEIMPMDLDEANLRKTKAESLLTELAAGKQIAKLGGPLKASEAIYAARAVSAITGQYLDESRF